MEVVYEKTTLSKINDAIKDAKSNNRKIEKIILTKDEYRDLFYFVTHFYDYDEIHFDTYGIFFRGVKIIQEVI